MKKRILSTVLVLAMTVSVLSASLVASAANPFSDVKSGDWFYTAVDYAYTNKIMNGTSATTFTPGARTSRGMIVTILHRMAGTPSAIEKTFTDVKPTAYYANPISWATGTSRIANGYGNNRFGPDDAITREQMAVFLHNYSKYCGKSFSTAPADISSFADSSTISSWAVSSMEWAYGAKLIGGVGDNKLDPKGYTTRAQAATMIMRYIETFGIASTTDEQNGYYKIGFDPNIGKSVLVPTVQVFFGKKLVAPENPTREGYIFDGWYTKPEGGEKFDFNSEISSSFTLYAHWKKA